MVQQVVGVAVAVSTHHHQGNEGGQEDGGQHPNGHDHHRLHGDDGSQGVGSRQQGERKVFLTRVLVVWAWPLWLIAHLWRSWSLVVGSLVVTNS